MKKKSLFKRFTAYMKRTAFYKALAVLMLALGYVATIFVGDGTAMMMFLLFFVPALLIADDEES